MFGRTFPADVKDHDSIAAWLEYVPSIVASGQFKGNPLWRQEGGLAHVNDGLNLLKEGKVGCSLPPPGSGTDS